jgi:hypothetical protein
LAQSVVDMPVMALQFSMFLAFMVYVDQSRRAELKARDLATKPQLDQPIPPLPVGSR